MDKKQKQIEELVQMLNSAWEQFKDDLIDFEELDQKVNKCMADYKAGTEVGNIWLIMPFGDYKDEKIVELNTSYLMYLHEQEWFEKKFKRHYEEVTTVLKGRGEL